MLENEPLDDRIAVVKQRIEDAKNEILCGFKVSQVEAHSDMVPALKIIADDFKIWMEAVMHMCDQDDPGTFCDALEEIYKEKKRDRN